MKLEINRNLVSAEADIKTVQALVRDLSQTSEALIVLWKNDDEYLQAAGVPANGFRLTYANRATGQALVSRNQKLKQRTVMVAFDHFVAGSPNWRGDLGWEPANAQAAAVENRLARRRALPLVLSLAFFALAFVPLVFATRMVADALIFLPLCAQANPDVSHYEHGSGGDGVPGLTGTSYSEPTCWYQDNSHVPLARIVGSGRALTYDALGGFLQVIAPVVIIVALLFAAFRVAAARRKAALQSA